MTKDRLDKYQKLKVEIFDISAEISDIRENGELATFDTVNSAAVFPYKKKPVVVMGFGVSRLPKLEARLKKRMIECEAIETFVDSVEDSIMWRLLTNRYIKGMTLKETASLVGYTENYAGTLITDFLNSVGHRW